MTLGVGHLEKMSLRVSSSIDKLIQVDYRFAS
jgi:hypothetical protein